MNHMGDRSGCRHIHHCVEPQTNRWKAAEFKGVEPAQVFCSDCGVWLYEKPINWDLVPKNKVERREARIDDSRSGKSAAQPARHTGAPRREHAG